MSHRAYNQMSFADQLLIEHKALFELDELNQMINWQKFSDIISCIHNKKQGNSAFAPILMFKALLLQSWYNLSDVALEKQLARDLMFRRFVGLNLSDSIPDHTTIWRFREALKNEQLFDQLLLEIQDQLAQKSLFIQHGSISIVDASVIEAQRCRPNKDKNGNNTQDQAAGYTSKIFADGQKKSCYGFKAHLNVDEDGFVKAMKFTNASLHDSNIFEELLQSYDEACTADGAYLSKKNGKILAQRNIENLILNRAYRNKPLTPEEKQNNQKISPIRSIVERVFGIFKLHYGMRKSRYLGLERNKMRLGLMCIAYNIKTGLRIFKEMMQYKSA